MGNKISVFLVITFGLISFSGLTQTFVPDDNFEQALIDLGLDSGPLDDFVPTANISTLSSLDVSDRNIFDLTGIEDFTSLSILDCSINQLTNLDISQNINLTELYIPNNQITDIDLTSLPNLKIFWCNSNFISSLNVSQNPNLISLVCGNNLLKSLDVSNNTSLVVLTFQKNEIPSINLTNLSNLNRLQCGGNLLTSLDISNNLNLSYLSCEENQITALDTSNNTNLGTLICYFNLLTELDVTKNTSLVVLDCNNNILCRLNVKNGNNNFAVINFGFNYFLGCVVVDDPVNVPSNWKPVDFSGYVSSENQCANTVQVDSLSDVVIGNSYTLPFINNGNYFTETGGQGTMLNAGDVITTSQTIYIYNETTCDSNETSFSVFINNDNYYIPKYFTPNNDGSNDLWAVLDNTNSVNNITIYNKYGKLLKFLPSNSLEWDGTFNGKILPSDDYWYVIVLNSSEVLKGHFALKR